MSTLRLSIPIAYRDRAERSTVRSRRKSSAVNTLRIALVDFHVFQLRTVHFLTVTRMDTLAAGGLMAALMRSPKGKQWLIRAWVPLLTLAIAGVVAVIVVTGHLYARSPEMLVWGYVALEMLFACGIVSSLITPVGCAWRGFLRRPRLGWIGKVSYGAYIFHWPIMVLVGKVWRSGKVNTHLGFWSNQIAWWIITFTITFTCAYLSYRFYESRFLSLKSRFRPGR